MKTMKQCKDCKWNDVCPHDFVDIHFSEESPDFFPPRDDTSFDGGSTYEDCMYGN